MIFELEATSIMFTPVFGIFFAFPYLKRTCGLFAWGNGYYIYNSNTNIIFNIVNHVVDRGTCSFATFFMIGCATAWADMLCINLWLAIAQLTARLPLS
jgi:hypothetical protein